MQVLQLMRRHSIPIDYTLGKECGTGGADGQVFELLNAHNLLIPTNKVIKYSIIYDTAIRPATVYMEEIWPVLDMALHMPSDVCVQVYEHGYLGDHSDEDGRLFVIYYYVMEKLLEISDDERKVFHSILSHEDRNICKDFSSQKINEMLLGMGRGLDFDAKKIKLFCDNIKKSFLLHQDISPRNILKNANGDFKLIDLDRSKLITNIGDYNAENKS
jgi:serine/threonine protein kinase